MPPSKIQTGIFSDTLRRRLEGNVPSAEPFQYIPGLQGCLCARRENWSSHPCSQAGLLTLVLPEKWLPLTTDYYKYMFQVKCSSTLFLKAPALASLALVSTYNQ